MVRSLTRSRLSPTGSTAGMSATAGGWSTSTTSRASPIKNKPPKASAKASAARREARALAQGQSGSARRAALSVAATAEHELGLVAIQQGDPAAARQLLHAADAAIAEVLASEPELDPLGALAGRQASIKVRLKALG